MKLSDFDFELPDELIAQFPPEDRAGGRMLRVDEDRLCDLAVRQLPEQLVAGDLVVINNTKVMAARLFGQKSSGGQIEALIERVTGEYTALAHMRASKSPKPGAIVYFEQYCAVVIGRSGALFNLEFEHPVLDILADIGHMPLPPYITRDDGADDLDRYQTVYAKSLGAVAAPTAGLHVDETMLASLASKGVDVAEVTLHVGAGTFQPVKSENLDEHVMHQERVEVSAAVAAKIVKTQQRGGRVVAIGTTVVRSLETMALEPNWQQSGFQGESQLFIRPGYRFAIVDALLTNFHLPKSTLLMLVSAFSGQQRIKAAYAHAIQARYRFFSYGDAMFLRRMAE
ncbi:MAG: tRNA preQ1(34) S-adenosylmethionine ribosyltransferase-isomerase QueA [Gammaproteobacteria bacterium]|nr:tRNA preQ1(34) S-adenosylmethionine ribosyltransferase-isomerase QueA [Gammaproteobacteria bacterium]